VKTSGMGGRIKNGWLVAVAGCAALALGCTAYSPSLGSSGGGSTPAQPAAALSVCDATGANCQTSNPIVSIASAPSITLVANWTNVPAGTHTQQIRMLLPNGDFYQHFDMSFGIATGSDGQANLKRRVGIQGTPIGERLLTGAWKVQVLLDDQVISQDTLQINP